jgi:hypothetical protein
VKVVVVKAVGEVRAISLGFSAVPPPATKTYGCEGAGDGMAFSEEGISFSSFINLAGSAEFFIFSKLVSPRYGTSCTSFGSCCLITQGSSSITPCLIFGGLDGTGAAATSVSNFNGELALYMGGGVGSLIECVVSRMGSLDVSRFCGLEVSANMSVQIYAASTALILTM